MHDIKIIRNNVDHFAKKISERNTNVDLKKLIDLDKKNRTLIQNKEKLEQEKKSISQKKDKSQFEKSKKISLEIDKFNKSQLETKNEINSILASLPNLALDDVPVGKDENSNKEIKKVSDVTKHDFKPLSHEELGLKLGKLNFDLASKTSGARFVFLKDQLALLERAISNYMLDIHTKKFGYQEISPPLIVNDSTMYGTGQLPKFESDQFEIKIDDDKS